MMDIMSIKYFVFLLGWAIDICGKCISERCRCNVKMYKWMQTQKNFYLLFVLNTNAVLCHG